MDPPDDPHRSLRRLGGVSLGLGLAGPLTCGLTSVAGLILGVWAWVNIRRDGGSHRDARWAIASVIVPLVPGLATLLLLFGYANAKVRQASCLGNITQLGLGVAMYRADYDGRCPLADRWCDSLAPYERHPLLFPCPAEPHSRLGYALNARLNGVDLDHTEPNTDRVVLFDATATWNTAGGPELFAPRHSGYGWLIFDDMRRRFARSDELDTVVWSPPR
ncbi:MAG: hypothetical protein FJX75_02265 [Armatimonadetes bacterium]|nr:hypothetical protein [Armatimonadota bacterium]